MKYIGNIFPQNLFQVELFYLNFNNEKISKEIFSSPPLRLNNDPILSSFEDTTLNLIPGSETENLINDIKSYFNNTHILEECWSHIHQPLESTNTHTHYGPGADISFSYYVKVPKDSGVFVIDLGSSNGPRIPFNPIEGGLFLFPSWVPHLVTKNLSKDVRISISGNLVKK